MNYTHEWIFTPASRAAWLSLLLLFVCFFVCPTPAHGQIRRTFTVRTGDDDLRGGTDNLNVKIKISRRGIPNLGRT